MAVLGDLMVDVVVRPATGPLPGTDVSGRVELRAGGSAANTARWLARLGARASLIAAVGRDPAGRALVSALRAEGVRLHVARPPRATTGRIAVLVSLDGERAFVADRGAADELRPSDVRPAWLSGARLLHLPAYSLLAEPLRAAALRALELARAQGARVSLDLASVHPLLASGRGAAVRLIQSVGPDVLFATEAEARAVLGDAWPAAAGRRRARDGPADSDGTSGSDVSAGAAPASSLPAEALLALAPIVVLKRGGAGATVLARSPGSGRPALRLDVAARPVAVSDTTGAGDAFDAGFIVAWLARLDAARGGRAAGLRRAAAAGNRAAGRQLTGARPELHLL